MTAPEGMWDMGDGDDLRRARFLLAHAREALIELDGAGVVTWASAGVGKLVGHEPTALVGRTWADMVHDEYREEVRCALTSDVEGLRYYVTTAAGIPLYVEEDGAWDPATGLRSMVLRLGPGEGLERLRDLVEHLPEAWLRDPAVAYAAIHEDDNDGFIMLSGLLRGTNKTFDYVARHRTTWGETKWLRMCSRERTGRDGLRCWDGFLTDVTEDETARGSTFGHPGPAASCA